MFDNGFSFFEKKKYNIVRVNIVIHIQYSPRVWGNRCIDVCQRRKQETAWTPGRGGKGKMERPPYGVFIDILIFGFSNFIFNVIFVFIFTKPSSDKISVGTHKKRFTGSHWGANCGGSEIIYGTIRQAYVGFCLPTHFRRDTIIINRTFFVEVWF